jgi:hypothetical protein
MGADSYVSTRRKSLIKAVTSFLKSKVSYDSTRYVKSPGLFAAPRRVDGFRLGVPSAELEDRLSALQIFGWNSTVTVQLSPGISANNCRCKKRAGCLRLLRC